MYIFISVDSIYVRSIIPSIIYGKDHLSIQCIQENLQHEDSIYKITLSKIVNNVPKLLLGIETDTNSPPAFLKVLFFTVIFIRVFAFCDLAYVGILKL